MLPPRRGNSPPIPSTIRSRGVNPEPAPVADLGTATWDPATGDSVLFTVDSATVNAWADTTDLSRGARIELFDVGPRLQMNGAILRLDVRPSLDPDTLVQLVVSTLDITFVYDPFPQPPPDGVRIGGRPGVADRARRGASRRADWAS